jgi:hypothetical protein
MAEELKWYSTFLVSVSPKFEIQYDQRNKLLHKNQGETMNEMVMISLILKRFGNFAVS